MCKKVLVRMFLAAFLLALPSVALASSGSSSGGDSLDSLGNVLTHLSEGELKDLVTLAWLGGCSMG